MAELYKKSKAAVRSFVPQDDPLYGVMLTQGSISQRLVFTVAWPCIKFT